MDRMGSADQNYCLLDAIPDGLFVLRKDFTVIYWNNIVADWTRISRKEILGANIKSLFPHLAKPKYSVFLEQIFDGGPPAFFSSQFHKHLIPCPLPDGKKRIVQTVVAGIRDMESESSYHALFTVQDLTDQTQRLRDYRIIFDKILNEVKRRKEAEEKLKSLASELNRSNNDLNDFASIVAHDLQEPLRKIITFGELLEETAGSLGDKEKDYIDRMTNSAERMQKFINSILEYSRVSKEPRLFESSDLGQIVSQVISDLEPRIADARGQVKVEKLPTLDADKIQMHQLFQNLIGNALKFHKKNKTPLIKIYSRHEKTGPYKIFVEDNGIGIDEQYFEKILKPFERLHSRDKYEGSGIGLAICSKIAARHGGELTVKSQPGKGAIFCVTLSGKQPETIP